MFSEPWPGGCFQNLDLVDVFRTLTWWMFSEPWPGGCFQNLDLVDVFRTLSWWRREWVTCGSRLRTPTSSEFLLSSLSMLSSKFIINFICAKTQKNNIIIHCRAYGARSKYSQYLESHFVIILQRMIHVSIRWFDTWWWGKYHEEGQQSSGWMVEWSQITLRKRARSKEAC